jgi:FixJ family two-component response regulator
MQVHILDEDSARRAQMAYLLKDGPFAPQVYGDRDELARFTPRSGLVLLNADSSCFEFSEVEARFGDSGVALPIAMYAENPRPGDIVDAIHAGAVDFLEWPIAFLEDRLRRICLRADARLAIARKRTAARARIAPLSPRETEVLCLMIQGLSNKGMGKQLGISARTVEIHRQQVLRKAGASSSAEAVRIGIYAGLDEE